jgi:hypothetical protein
MGKHLLTIIISYGNIFKRLNEVLVILFTRRSAMIKKFLFALCVALAVAGWASAYEEGDIPIEFEVGLGTSWGKAEGESSDYGFEFEVGVKAGKFFTDKVGVMGGLTIDYFNTPYSLSYAYYSLDADVSAICLTIPVGVYVSPSGGLIFGGGLSLSLPVINTSSGTVEDSYGSYSASGDDAIKFKSFFNFYIDAGYDFGESFGKGLKLLLRYSKSLGDISSDLSISKDFLHLMLGYSYITY